MTTYERIERATTGPDYAALVAELPYAAFLGMAIELDDAGDRRYRLPYRDDLIGNARIQALHGGAVGGFLESVALFEVLISQSQRRIPRVVDFSIDYLRSARAEDTFAACRALRHGRRVAQVQAEAWQADRAKPVAFVRADFLLQDV